ncbi:hypothetical protein [Phyllobacterium brassicacearum]|uniref:hypothetical protein n=1 Tax=Phyllobacterium brassicacearum TaxID=314235 RepID=UPI000D0EEB7F|nr:hypothetical protein [Phyllobacterium brassicacearum]
MNLRRVPSPQGRGEIGKVTTEMHLPKGVGILVTDSMNPIGGVVQKITNSGRVIALIELFGA